MRRSFAGSVIFASVAALLSACGVFLGSSPLPESANVQNTPWPRLVDGPEPAASTQTQPELVLLRTAKGEAIQDDITECAKRLIQRDAEMRATPVHSRDWTTQRAALLQRARALRDAN